MTAVLRPPPHVALLAALLLLAPLASAVGPTPAGAIRLASNADGVALEPGGRAAFVVEVRNEYPFEETVNLELLLSNPVEWRAEAAPRSFALAPGGFANVTLVVERAENATGGNATLRVSAEGAPFPGNDTALFDLIALPRAPEPPEPPALALRLEGPRAVRNADPGARVAIPFAIENAGAAPLTVTASARGPTGWIIDPRPASLALGEGGRDTIVLWVSVPDDASGSYRISLAARGLSDDGRLANATALADLVVDGPRAPEGHGAEGASAEGDGAAREELPRPTPPPASTPPDGARDAPPPRDPLLEIDVAIVRVPAGGMGAVRVVARNPGASPAGVSLIVEAPPGWSARLDPEILTVPAGGEAAAWLHVEPAREAVEGEAVVRSDRAAARVALAVSDPVDLDAADASHLATQARPFTAAPPAPAPPILAILAVALLGAGLHRALGDADRRWKTAAFLAALYSRTPPARLLDHPQRARLFALVAGEPGLHFNEIKRRAGLRTGALIHHLARLERHGIVTSRRDGNKRRFYAIGDAPAKAEPSGRGTRDDILRALDAAGGSMRRPDLAATLACSRQLLHYHLRALREEGRVVVTPDGRVARRPPGDG
ncbi:MAG TPA: hypothetical protein VM889_01490 [Candidatus Thermoplasmatota archaeon]|nr:hypothetical protein [Candidatus Thermoplasmatota archaeon]